MKIANLVGIRTKENPSDATIKSHALMLRAGYMKSVANGIWTLAAPAKRIAAKIEQIIRDEMNQVDGQEVMFPVVMPRELWEESGRYTSIGDEMVRFKDRSQRDLVLGMTHEEAVVHFVRDQVTSYQQLPVMVYQIQTKFRDEARSRGGLIRVREFTMKDAYSFHTTQACLEAYYQTVFDAYVRIFERVGMKNVVAVAADSGMMGGNLSHEFMLLTPVGEDTLVLCPKCDYKANMEVADGVLATNRDAVSNPMQEVFTGDAKEIAEVCNYLKTTPDKTIKAVCYNIKGEQGLVVCFIRGDLEVNEAKLKRAIQKEVAPANLQDTNELVAGNIGPIGLKLNNATLVYDRSLLGTNNMVIGANKSDYHVVGIDEKRDLAIKNAVDIAKVPEGAKCIHCGAPLSVQNGIEVGNIFQLGTKYTESMGMRVLNNKGESITPIMGCYGIGVGRAIASVAEETADEKGLNWPMQIAPWQVYLAVLRPDNQEVLAAGEQLYADLTKQGVEVLYDDRDQAPGYKFNDCDLMGIPIRVVVSPRSLANGEGEIQLRDGSYKQNVPLANLVQTIKDIVAAKTK